MYRALDIHYAGESLVNEMSRSARLCCAAGVNSGENRSFVKRNERNAEGTDARGTRVLFCLY